VKRIPLTQGKETLVSDQDYKYLMQWKWRAHNQGYAVREQWHRGASKSVLMHKVVAARKGVTGEIDHRNQNKLDNRRRNLRPATRSQNTSNGKIRADNQSGYKGVSWDEQSQRWRARLQCKGTPNEIGYFPGTEAGKEQAARAYNKAAKAHFGKFAYLNKV
jgi:hypothetical protein